METFAQSLNQLVTDCRNALLIPGAKAEVGLYGFFDKFFIDAFAAIRAQNEISILQQPAATTTTGVPDFRVQRGNNLLGWIELKAVAGKDLSKLGGHDKEQIARFRDGLSNLIVSNGWEWRHYRDGEQVGPVVRLGHDRLFDPMALAPEALDQEAVAGLETLFSNFFATPTANFATAENAVTALAQRARALKSALVTVGEKGADSSLAGMKTDFSNLLYKNGQPLTWEKFVDSFVQMACFGALVWRLETGSSISRLILPKVSKTVHPLLSQCMNILWLSELEDLNPLLEELCISVNHIPSDLFAYRDQVEGYYVPDPLVHAYEPFFQEYSPAARDEYGVFYTPVQIVSHIVSGIDKLLSNSFGHVDGIMDESVEFLDPATGTGTFLLGLANAAGRRAKEIGLSAPDAVREILENRASAFEIFPGPYAIANQRLEALLKALEAPATKRLPIYLADTLAAPESGMLPFSEFGTLGSAIAEEREEADKLKTAKEILVIFGNPPYERMQQKDFEPFASEFMTILREATPMQFRSELKSVKDLFVAFWLWSMWALQSPAARSSTSQLPVIRPADCHGMIAFVTNRTWIIGPSLTGLRGLMRQGASEIWVTDLGGDSRGSYGSYAFAGGDKNVFAIRTGVAIVWAIFKRNDSSTTQVYYRRMYGNTTAKLAELERAFDPADFRQVEGSGTKPFIPISWENPTLAASPRLDDLFADEAQTGLQSARDKSPYSPLGTRADEVYAVGETPKNRVTATTFGSLARWAELPKEARFKAWKTAQSSRRGGDAPDPKLLDSSKVREYSYRPLDVRWLYHDDQWIDWTRPYVEKIYENDPQSAALVTIVRDHGKGPAVIHVNRLMDQHVFRGSGGGKGIWFLWHPHDPASSVDPRAVVGDRRSGFSSAVLDWLDSIGRTGRFEEAYNYLLAVLSAPTYTARFWSALEVDFLRVPLTTDSELFDELAAIGAELRLAWEGAAPPTPTGTHWTGSSTLALGKAKFVGGTILFENGRAINGVPSSVWDYSVSQYQVVPRWFSARETWTAASISEQKAALNLIASVSALRKAEVRTDEALSRLID